MRDLMSMVAILLLMACGGNEDAGESSQPEVSSQAGVSEGAKPSPASATSADPAFQATISGALDRTLEGDHVRAGAKYRRYHINMASREPAGEPGVIIAFGRDDVSSPAPGTYTLTDLRGGGFSGNVEIYGDPQRDFDITSGELVVSSARGDALTGRFELTAKERPEQYGGPSDEIRVSGTFRSEPAD